MPKARNFYASFGTGRGRALFVVALMLFNLLLSTFSGAVVYADTNEGESVSTETTEVEVSETTEPTEEEIVVEEEEETTNEEDVESTEEDSDELVTEEATFSVALSEPEVKVPDIEVSFDCWYRTGSMFAFVVNIDSDDYYEIEAGSTFNMTDGATHDDIIPTEFDEGLNSVTVKGWDGATIEWVLGDNPAEEIATTEAPMCDGPTLRDVIAENENLSMLEEALNYLEEYKQCSELIWQLETPLNGDFRGDVQAAPYLTSGLTVFAPNDEAFLNLIPAPTSPENEFKQLQGNPDELCALIASHIVEGELVSTDITEAGDTVKTIWNDVDGIFLQIVGGKAFADNGQVVAADNFAVNGVLHVVNEVLLPQSVGTIDPVVTDSTSPALSGSIVPPYVSTGEEVEYEMYCVVVRVDGVPYIATVKGLNWSIAEGKVDLNPTDDDTLFDVVVRYCNVECDDNEQVVSAADENIPVLTIGDRLVGLTMTRGVVSYPEPEEEEDDGEVLGDTDTKTPDEDVVTYTSTCGKGICGDVATVDPSTIDSDGDGVVDSEDPAPYDPTITGLETDNVTSNDTTADDTDDVSDSENDVFWWFIVGGGFTVLAYLYRQRTGYTS